MNTAHTNQPHKAMRYTSWGIIIDDVVFPDGRTAMGVLGGGGLYAVAGMRLWHPDVGIIADVGADFDPALLAKLDLHAGGVRVTDHPTPRAWQLFEEDGTRTQIPRVPLDAWRAQLAQTVPSLHGLDGLRAIHFLGRGLPDDVDTVAHIAARGVRIGFEPIIEEGLNATERNRVLACLEHVEIFSPGLAETRMLIGGHAPVAALQRFAELGPSIVALRMGAEGSLIYHRDTQRTVRVPAAPATVVDVTGAGNAYCGGLLVGWIEHAHLETAAACAAVSAAAMLTQISVPAMTPALLADAQRQRDAMLPLIQDIAGDADG